MLFGASMSWERLVLLLTTPDNLPILFVVLTLGVFTALSLRGREPDAAEERLSQPHD